MKINPVVSVIIPTYNTAAFIAETLDSVFSQTFQDFEVIVINDGSPDTDALEQVLAPSQPRIVYIRQENRGLAGARNTGIRQARGKYLAFLDSDDCWLPDYLAFQMKMFEEPCSVDAVYCDAQFFGNPDFAGKTYMQVFASHGPVNIQSLISRDCQVIVSCTIALKCAVVEAGLFDETLRCCEDYDLWLRILQRGGQMAYQRKVLGRYRSRPGGLSQNTKKMSETLVAIYEKADRTMGLPDETRAILENQLIKVRASVDLEAGRNSLASSDFARAKESFIKANTFFHRTKLNAVILGLRIAPRLTRFAVMGWESAISGSLPTKSVQAD